MLRFSNSALSFLGAGLGMFGQWVVFCISPGGIALGGILMSFVKCFTALFLSSGGLRMLLCDLVMFYCLCCFL